MGLGAVGTDLLAALILTSALRRRLGRRSWRAVHWAAYLCWPAALLHSIGLSQDRRAGALRDLALACVIAVLAALVWRLAGTRLSATNAASRRAVGRAQYSIVIRKAFPVALLSRSPGRVGG